MVHRYLILAASALFATPVIAHDAHLPSRGVIENGQCRFHASEWNMSRVERMFVSMPQSTRMNLQHVLRHAGLYAGRDDGIWGPGTACALTAVASRYPAPMNDSALVAFFEYLLDGGFVADYPGTPHHIPHRGVLY